MAVIKANYVKIGMFVSLAVLLTVAAAIILGAGSFTENEVLMETYIEDSVQGLDVGGAVKFRGIPIGKIKEVTFVHPTYTAPDTPEGRRAMRYARIVFSVDSDRMCRKQCQGFVGQVDDGLRVFRKNLGITGMVYLDLDFLEPHADRTTLPVPWTPEHLYIPAARSLVKAVTDIIQNLTDQLSSFDVREPISALTEILESVRTDMHEAKLGTAGKNLGEILEKVNAMTTDFESWRKGAGLSKSSADLLATVSSLKTLTTELENQLPLLVKNAGGLVQNVDGVTQESRASLVESLENLRQATETLNQTLARVKEEPSLLLRNTSAE